MDSLDTFLARLESTNPNLRTHLSLSQIYMFITHAAQLKNDIINTQYSKHDSSTLPPFLPPTINQFFQKALNLLDEALVDQCWELLCDMCWNTEYASALASDPENTFRSFGLETGLSMYAGFECLLRHTKPMLLFILCSASRTFYPPSMYCISNGCRNRLPIKKSESKAVNLYTLSQGTIPSYHVHLYCPSKSLFAFNTLLLSYRIKPGCKTSYYHNYSVHNRERHYYQGVPEFLEVGDHQFVERRLVELWITLMGTSWCAIPPPAYIMLS